MLGQKQTTTVLAISGARVLTQVGDRLIHRAAFARGKSATVTVLEIPKGHGKVVKADLSCGVALLMEDGACFHCVGREFYEFANAYAEAKP